MSQNSKIEWTDHTFNPWWGCQKVSEGCKHCYAETLDNRWKGGHWGPRSDRKIMSEPYWNQPIKWNAAAQLAGIPAKVFCASMADVFEDHALVHLHRMRLFELIDATPWLIWQLLTKRPENIMRFIPLHWSQALPKNVWVGTSVENHAAADERIPHLMRVRASVHFLSCEPLLGPLDLSEWFGLYEVDNNKWACKVGSRWDNSPDWVIVGGESGPHARPMNPDWARTLRDQCQAAEVPFYFKQWGEYLPFSQANEDYSTQIKTKDPLIRVTNYTTYYKIGKKASGRLLDGGEWNEFPEIKIPNDATKKNA